MYNIYIRPLREEDAKKSFVWRNDPDVWHFTGSRPDREITYEIEKEWITKVLNDKTCRRFAIIVDDNYIGNIQLTDIKNNSAEYHIFIGDKGWWGKGISRLATYQILHYAKIELGLENVYLSVRNDNLRAYKLYLKSSFIKISEDDEGWIKMNCVLKDILPPMVSVFVMVYNHEPYLRECLDGILMQKCDFSYNVVVGEDCSTDKSRKILLSYQENFPGKFKLLLHEKNIGAVKNQNEVLLNCDGKYIAICEGDDYWTDPLKLQKQVNILENNPEFNVCFHQFYRLEDGKFKELNKEIVGAHMKKSNNNIGFEFTLEELFNEWFIGTLTMIFRSSTLDFNIINKYTNFFDLHVFYYCLEKKNGFFLIDNMAVYRRHGGGAWAGATMEERLATDLISYRELYRISPNKFTKHLYRRSLKRKYNFFLQKKLNQLIECFARLKRSLNSILIT